MDTAFKSPPFSSYTTGQLSQFLIDGRDNDGSIAREIERRTKVMAGDVSVMFDGERLRFARTGKAR